MLQLLFIGAGPHSLATLTRLLEPNPDPGVDAPQRHVNAKSKVCATRTACPTPLHRQSSCVAHPHTSVAAAALRPSLAGAELLAVAAHVPRVQGCPDSMAGSPCGNRRPIRWVQPW